MIDIEAIRARFSQLSPHLDERGRRLLAAAEACCGLWRDRRVSRATGIAASTIGRGLKELADRLPPGRVRRRAAGARRRWSGTRGCCADLLALVEPAARGDPMSPLRWTCKSLRRLAEELTARGHQVSRTVVGELLNAGRFSLQANRKTREGSEPPRPGRAVRPHQRQRDGGTGGAAAGDLGRHQEEGTGRRLQERGPRMAPAGQPGGGPGARLPDHGTRPRGALRRLRPGGQRGLGQCRHRPRHGRLRGADTSAAGGRSVGRARYPAAEPSADHRRWRRQQRLARAAVEDANCSGWPTRLGLDIAVSHLPPGTSKWNKIEHRLFSFISQNWRAKPLVSYRVIVDLIGATTTTTGLTVHCELDTSHYPKGIAVSDAEMAALNITRARLPRRVELHHPPSQQLRWSGYPLTSPKRPG